MIKKVADQREHEILQFFKGEHRALQDGIRIYNNYLSTIFSARLANRIIRWDDPHPDGKSCLPRIVFVGSAHVSGRDNFHNQTFPFVAEHLLQELATASGLELHVFNYTMDNDLSREGPQTSHMCIANLVGHPVDVIVWGFDDSMMASRPAQFEAFVRWASSLNPAMIVVHREGPHGMSRRGKQEVLVNISPGHNAIVYKDQGDLPKQRQETYRESSQWK